jgi:hypothetical protein
MTMIYVTDISKTKIAINPDHVVAVMPIIEGEHEGKTALGLVNGTIVVEETDIELVGILNGN